MDLLSMKLFVSVSKTHNFTKTAQEFYMTQPVVSRRMQELENELGFDLFSRRHHGVILTREGELLAPVFEEALLKIDHGIYSIRSQLTKTDREVFVAAITPAISLLLPAAIGEFSSLYPDIRVHVHRMVPKQIRDDLLTGTHDIYISCRADLVTDNEWNTCVVRSDPVGLIVRKNEPCDTPEQARELLKESLVYLIPEEDSPSTTRQSREILAMLGLGHVRQTELRPIESIFFNIASGMGVAVLPDQIGPFNAFGLKTVSLGIDLQADITMAWRKDAPEQVRLFAELVKKRIGETSR